MSWTEDSKWESDWWGNCVNTTREELLQFSYAKRMELETFYDGRSPYNIDLCGRSILDIGGGPVSMLLKCVHGGTLTVIDPCSYPVWVEMRYGAANINYHRIKAEDFTMPGQEYSEAWIYNVLQHTVDPVKIIQNVKSCAKVIRIFEFIDAGTGPGHPHELTEAKLNEWLGGKGTVEMIDEHGAVGKCYYGVF